MLRKKNNQKNNKNQANSLICDPDYVNHSLQPWLLLPQILVSAHLVEGNNCDSDRQWD